MQGKVEVVGLRDFQKALRAADPKWPRELRVASREAAETVAGAASASFASRGGVAPKAAPSVKAPAEQRRARVRLGSDRYPFALGAEFGGGKYGAGNPTLRGGYTTQFEPHRGKEGYSLFPAIRRLRPEVIEKYGDALERIAAEAFPK